VVVKLAQVDKGTSTAEVLLPVDMDFDSGLPTAEVVVPTDVRSTLDIYVDWRGLLVLVVWDKDEELLCVDVKEITGLKLELELELALGNVKVLLDEADDEEAGIGITVSVSSEVVSDLD